jgi:hypothetical protein
VGFDFLFVHTVNVTQSRYMLRDDGNIRDNLDRISDVVLYNFTLVLILVSSSLFTNLILY